jgi:hypothetical protein
MLIWLKESQMTLTAECDCGRHPQISLRWSYFPAQPPGTIRARLLLRGVGRVILRAGDRTAEAAQAWGAPDGQIDLRVLLAGESDGPVALSLVVLGPPTGHGGTITVLAAQLEELLITPS